MDLLGTFNPLHHVQDNLLLSHSKPAANPKHSTKSDQWYTPEKLLRLELETLGHIDFDPFSCEKANETINANHWAGLDSKFPHLRDGFDELCWPLCGQYTLHINPPGGKIGNKSKPALAWQMLMDYRDAGNLAHAIFIAFSIESLQVTQSCSSAMMDFPMCVPSKRVRFDCPGGAKVSPTHAQAIIYVPGGVDKTDKFMETFSGIGACKR